MQRQKMEFSVRTHLTNVVAFGAEAVLHPERRSEVQIWQAEQVTVISILLC